MNEKSGDIKQHVLSDREKLPMVKGAHFSVTPRAFLFLLFSEVNGNIGSEGGLSFRPCRLLAHLGPWWKHALLLNLELVLCSSSVEYQVARGGSVTRALVEACCDKSLVLRFRQRNGYSLRCLLCAQV